MESIKVGILGYGKLGQYLARAILEQEASVTDASQSASRAQPKLKLAFIWNRTPAKVQEEDAVSHLLLEDINDAHTRGADIIIEVSHPNVVAEHGAKLCKHARLVIGSPTALADSKVEKALRSAAQGDDCKGIFVPSGALWGAEDIQKMANLGTLKALKITMRKHPSSFKLSPPLKELNDNVTDGAVELYAGPVRALCPLAPNNVNTMACASLAAHNLGFDGVQASLVSDPNLTAHVIDIDVTGPDGFTVKTERYNPAKVGAVTGNATYASFWSSLLKAAVAANTNTFNFC